MLVKIHDPPALFPVDRARPRAEEPDTGRAAGRGESYRGCGADRGRHLAPAAHLADRQLQIGRYFAAFTPEMPEQPVHRGGDRRAVGAEPETDSMDVKERVRHARSLLSLRGASPLQVAPWGASLGR